MPDPLTLAARLRSLREAAGLTQRALAALAGVSQSAIDHIERGRNTNPSMRTLIGLARGLGLDVAELMGSKEQ